MENLLLVADDIDDMFHVALHLFPRVAGFIGASTLFTATVAAFVLSPQVALTALAALLSFSMFDRLRRRRLQAE
jgi:hypothetical protein